MRRRNRCWCLGELGERLAVEVVGHVPVVAGHRRRAIAAVTRDGGGEEEADGPSLGAFDELRGVVGAQRDLRLGEDLRGARDVEGEVGRRDLERVPRGPQAGEVRLLRPARRHHLGSARDSSEDDAQHVVAGGRSDLVEVVEHQHERRGAVAHRRGEQRCGPTERRDAVPADVGRQAVHAGRHLRIRGRQQGEERRGIVVESVERHPRDGSFLGVRPLGHEGGLAVSGGRRDAHDATRARPRGLEDVGSTDGASGWGLRDQ